MRRYCYRRRGDRRGIIKRYRAGTAGVQPQLRAATTSDSVVRATATAAVAPAPVATVTTVSEAVDISHCHPVATAHGAEADTRPCPLEDGRVVRCANNPPLSHVGSADLLAASTKQPGAPPQRRVLVDDEKDCVAVDGDYSWSRRRWPYQQAADIWRLRAAVTFC